MITICNKPTPLGVREVTVSFHGNGTNRTIKTQDQADQLGYGDLFRQLSGHTKEPTIMIEHRGNDAGKVTVSGGRKRASRSKRRKGKR
ncbi:MAG TPA: hypothetical protein VHO25_14545 [Polyangiaceae bacterium]|nr:hypothetical protein [Polyangiaceae bacterium]